MKLKQLKNRLNIIQNYDIEIDITANPYDFELEDLFKMATRINKKRRFLFVSTLLGKHLAVLPQVPLLTGTLLAMMYHHKLTGKEAVEISEIVEALKKPEKAQEVYERL